MDLLDSDEVVCACNDFTIRVWDEFRCKQIIDVPNIIHSLTHNKNGDIIAACGDSTIRTFSRDWSRKIKGDDFDLYSNQCSDTKKKQTNPFDG